MGRSVSVPNDAEHVIYYNFGEELQEYWELYKADEAGENEDGEYPDEWFTQDYWDDFLYDLENVLKCFPSVESADEWLDNEDHVIAENGLVQFGVSEYCGLVSIWAVPKEPDYYGTDMTGLAKSWLDKNWHKVEAAYPDRYAKIGTFNNGESVYRKVDR